MREKRGKVAQGHWNGNQVMGAQSLKINEGKSIWRVVDAEVRHARCPEGKGGRNNAQVICSLKRTCMLHKTEI